MLLSIAVYFAYLQIGTCLCNTELTTTSVNPVQLGVWHLYVRDGTVVEQNESAVQFSVHGNSGISSISFTKLIISLDNSVSRRIEIYRSIVTGFAEENGLEFEEVAICRNLSRYKTIYRITKSGSPGEVLHIVYFDAQDIDVVVTSRGVPLSTILSMVRVSYKNNPVNKWHWEKGL